VTGCGILCGAACTGATSARKLFKKRTKDTNNIGKNIDKLALAISSKWNENSIPLSSVSDQILYIRDLIYLKLIYRKLTG
jgi:hypothetical protein